MSCDLSQKWLDIPHENFSGIDNRKIIINITDRYRNYLINYFFLKKYESHIIFAGMADEHERFCKEWDLNIPLLEVNDFLDLAKKISNSRFFIGNQSACFQIAEATKTRRLLEICPMMPNVIPIGGNAHDFYHQAECEYYFEKLFNLNTNL